MSNFRCDIAKLDGAHEGIPVLGESLDAGPEDAVGACR